MPTVFAHLSDVHLATPSGAVHGLGARHLNVKRALGLANWTLSRRKVHLRSALDRLTADLASQRPDHIIVSGDLTNLGLPGEYEAALEWLRSAVGPPRRVTVVPGNHDIYCRLWRDPGVERWRDYMMSDPRGAALTSPVERGFPFVRVIGGVAVVGLVSGVPTRPFRASGRLGARQLAALADVLDRLSREGLFRLVVIHHPPLAGQADARRGLVDAGPLERVLREHGAELVVHGHNHIDMAASREWSSAESLDGAKKSAVTTRTGTVHVIGVASASVGRTHGREPLARYNLYRIDERTGAGSRAGIEVVSRGLVGPDGPVRELGRRKLEAAPV